MTILELLQLTVESKASDLHLITGVAPALRIDGELTYMTDKGILTETMIEEMITSILTPEQKELLLANKELDLSYGYGTNKDATIGRFRINLYYEKGTLSGAFRYLPPVIRTIEQLRLPKVCHTFAALRQGFVLVTGPTGHGKSSTLAAIVNEINVQRASHILTVEDPIEYVYPEGKSLTSQREMGVDTHSWALALRSALREDPDVVMIGEMRDPETMAAAMTIAETGHLVFSTLHTNSAAQTVDRIIDSFPADQQMQIRVQLAATLKGIISQRLLPAIDGGRVPAVEIMLGTPAIATNVREGKTHLIDSIIQTSHDVGMVTFDESLAELVLGGIVSMDVATSFSLRPDELIHLLG